MVGRGSDSEKIQEIAKKTINREISLGEIRLMPYIQYVMVNERLIERRRINDIETKILYDWEEEGFIKLLPSRLEVTKKFWDFINDIVWEAYVVYDEHDDVAAGSGG